MKSRIPEYARGTPLDQLVKVACVGCGQDRFAKTSLVGWNTPQHHRARDVTATCLVCGAVDSQSSQWVSVRGW
jgi:hypothetical protein